MKKIIKELVVPTLLAILLGYFSGKYVYGRYHDKVYDDLSSSRLYLVSNGEYDTIDKMREENISGNYVYYKLDNKYKTVVGITNNYDNVSKIKELYDDDLVVMEYYIARDILDNKQDEYEIKLSKANDKYEIKEAVSNILDLYRTDDSIRLIAIN